jgi:hypothetical protein
MNPLLIILCLFFAATSYSQNTTHYTAYKVQEGKYIDSSWEWGVYRKCDMKVTLDKYGLSVGDKVFFITDDDKDGLLFSNCTMSKHSYTLVENKTTPCTVLIYSYPNGIMSLVVMYDDYILRYLIK